MRIIQLVAGGLFALVLLVAASTLLPHKSKAIQSAQNPLYGAANPASAQVPEPVTLRPTTSADGAQTHRPLSLDTAAIEAAWRAWMLRHEVSKGAISIGLNGTVIGGAGAGRAPDIAYPVASLSKAVTAMCLDQVLKQTNHSWSTHLSDLPEVWDALGMAPHTALSNLPLSALVTHTSGLPKNIGYDETAGEGRNLYTQANFARAALRDPEHLPDSRKHLYSNVNFALLGQIIEGFTGQAYGDYCQSAVMAPANAKSAQVAGRMWATAGFGGWTVSADDYARFVMHWYGPTRSYVQRPTDFAYDRGSGAGLGVFNSPQNGHNIMNHGGLWRSKMPERRIGAMFIATSTGAVFVANWQGSLPSDAYSDLHRSIRALLH